MERGFTNLSICFGCTGGQHRSVYSAQHLAEHLNQKFGVQVNLMHREQNIEQTFKAKAKDYLLITRSVPGPYLLRIYTNSLYTEIVRS